MDLVKARERAKKKAGKKKKKRTAKKKAGARATPNARPEPASAEEVRKEARSAELQEKAMEEQSRAKAEERETPPSHSEPAPIKGNEEPGPVGSEDRPSSSAPEISELDVFDDEAFGEDLPPAGNVGESLDDLVLGDDDDMSWEIGPDEMKRSPSPEPEARSEPQPKKKRPVAAERSPRQEKSVEVEAEPGRSGDAGERGHEVPAASGGDWQVSEPAATALTEKKSSPPRIELEWEDQGPAWSFNGATATDDDFFALVTEDLYMREFGRPAEDDTSEKIELLSFRLADEIYAVPLTSIRQIIKMTPITMIPRAPKYVLGIISLRGSVIPVFDLRQRLHLSFSAPSRKTRIVVVAEENCMVGLIVDEVEQVVRMPESGIEPPPPVLAGVEADYIEGIGRSANKMVIVLALNKILVPVIATQR